MVVSTQGDRTHFQMGRGGADLGAWWGRGGGELGAWWGEPGGGVGRAWGRGGGGLGAGRGPEEVGPACGLRDRARWRNCGRCKG